MGIPLDSNLRYLCHKFSRGVGHQKDGIYIEENFLQVSNGGLQLSTYHRIQLMEDLPLHQL
jgi:hypothetical protein